jgi:cytochrome c oxidase assembly protein subunit 11
MARGSGNGAQNFRVAAGLFAVAAGMVGLAYASVPLYDLFCRVTGYGGTTRVVEPGAAPVEVGERVITVRFNADTQSGLPWRFAPVQRAMTLRVGETALAFYRAENLGADALVGTATFNVTPQIAGAYFNKIDCFCFEDQFLRPGETAELAVQFYVDPAIVDDPDTAGIGTITLSYMFFDAGAEAVARHLTAAEADASGATTSN